MDAAPATTPSGERVFSISACYVGPVDEGEQAIKPLRAYGAPIQHQIGPRSYLEIQSAGDAIFPRGRRYYWKAQFLRELSDPAIDTLLRAYASAPAESLLVLQHVGGAIARIPVTDTPYANRDALYDCFPISIWDDPEQDSTHVRWARELWEAMRPFSTGGVYANNLGEEGTERIAAAYGENYARLLELKIRSDQFFPFEPEYQAVDRIGPPAPRMIADPLAAFSGPLGVHSRPGRASKRVRSRPLNRRKRKLIQNISDIVTGR